MDAVRSAEAHSAAPLGPRPHPAPRPIDFTDRAAMRAWTDKQLVAVITSGGAVTGGSRLMPAYGDSLSPKEIADLVAYVRSLSK